MDVEDPLSLDQVASVVGVHYQTVYRWVRSGHLQATKIHGKYFVQQSDLVELQERSSKPAPPPPPSKARLKRHSAAMTKALLEGDETAAQQITRQLMSNGTTATAFISSVLVPPLVYLGQAWHDGELEIYVEHRASAMVERILGSLSPNPRGRRRGTVVVAAPSGEHHSLPTSMATAALREDLWEVHHLGADTPSEQLLAFVDHHPVDLVVICTTSTQSVSSAYAAKTALESGPGIPTLIGAPGGSLSQLQQDARASLK
jgi:excisionase family DNA binding protein